MVAQSIIDEQRREFGLPSQVNGNAPATLRMNISRGLVHQYVLTTNCFVTEPINPPLVGSQLIVIFTQDTVGSRSVTWGVCFRDAPIWVAGAPNTKATAVFVYDGASYQYLDGSSAFASSGLQIVPDTGSALLASDTISALANPAPTSGAMTASGVAPTITKPTVAAIAPGAGAVTESGAAPLVSGYLTPPAANLVVQGQVPTRTP